MKAAGEITFYATDWCGASRRARRFLDQHMIPYRWIDIDQDEAVARIVEGLNRGFRSVPTLVWPDGSRLVEPSDEELSRELGVE